MSSSSLLIVFISILIFILIDWGLKKAIQSKDFDGRILTHFRVIFIFWYVLISFVVARGGFQGSFLQIPTLLFVCLGSFALALFISWTKIGEALSHMDWEHLVGFHGYRVLLELALYLYFLEGLAPKDITFLGYNFGVLAGLFALLMIPSLLNRPQLRLIKLWNSLSLILLLITTGLIFLNFTGTSSHFLAPPTWMLQVPQVYIPTLLLPFAFLGHLIIFRKIRDYDY